MLPIKHIRAKVFGMTQSAFAEVAGVSQATVCRWENSEFEPNRNELARIREAALASGKPWDDAWFFDIPADPPEPAQATS